MLLSAFVEPTQPLLVFLDVLRMDPIPPVIPFARKARGLPSLDRLNRQVASVFIVFVETVVVRLRISKAREQPFRRHWILEVLIDLHLGGWCEQHDGEMTRAATDARGPAQEVGRVGARSPLPDVDMPGFDMGHVPSGCSPSRSRRSGSSRSRLVSIRYSRQMTQDCLSSETWTDEANVNPRTARTMIAPLATCCPTPPPHGEACAEPPTENSVDSTRRRRHELGRRRRHERIDRTIVRGSGTLQGSAGSSAVRSGTTNGLRYSRRDSSLAASAKSPTKRPSSRRGSPRARGWPGWRRGPRRSRADTRGSARRHRPSRRCP